MGLYAAYGSNMDTDLMKERCPHSPTRGTGWIKDWRLTFGGEDIGWEGAVATIVEEPGACVFVLLYDMLDDDEKRLDDIERALPDLYDKIHLRVSTLDGDVLAWTYVLNDYEGGLPAARYLGIMADAAEKAGAPDDYVNDLRTRPCL